MATEQVEADSVRASVAPSLPAKAVGFQQWYLLGILTTIYTLSFLDRGALNLMVNPIKADLGITDVQMSLLLGLAFILLFSTCSIPFGYVADRFSRRGLICGAVFFWSCMSAMCGFAGTYWPLFFGRTGLGVGEAALQPAGFSLVRDSFPLNRRSRAFSIYQMGPVLGTGLATLIGGALYGFASHGGAAGIPILGALRPWQFAIAVPGLLGIPLAFLMLTVREPARTALKTGADTPSFGDMYRHVRLHWKVYVPLVTWTTLFSLGGAGWSGWLAAAIGRNWGLSPAEIGKHYGPITLVCTPIALLTMGFVMDYLVKRGFKEGPLRVMLVTQSLHLIPTLMILHMPTQTLMWGCIVLSALLGGGSQLAAASLISEITPGRLMGKTVAVFNVIQVVLGLAMGPTVVALVSDHFFSGKLAIVSAMTLCYAIIMSGSLTALVLLFRGTREWHRHNVATV